MELRIEKLVFEGQALARQDNFVWFVEGALPGERVEADEIRRARRHGFARVRKILEPSPHRLNPPCPVFDTCGGCHMLDLDYPEQVKAKEGFVREALRRIPDLESVMQPIWPSPRVQGFRNRMAFSVAKNDDGVIAGLHARYDAEAVVSARACVLPLPGILDTLCAAESAMRNDPNPPPVRIEIREGERTGERMIRLFMPTARPPSETFLQTISPHTQARAWTLPDGSTHRDAGSREWISERLDRFEFRLGPDDFFQTHTTQAERLFRAVGEAAAAERVQTAWDIYAGVGAISCFLAAAAEHVVAIEGRPSAVRAAQASAQLNGIENVDVICADVTKTRLEGPVPDLVVVDPPRVGLSPALRSRLCAVGPTRIFYISCNPATLARDLEEFTGSGYRAEHVQPLDMFPHSFHVETWVVLRRAR